MYNRLSPAVFLAAHTPPHTQVCFEIWAEQTAFWAKLSHGLRRNLQLIQVCVIVFIFDLEKNARIFLWKESKPFASSPAFTHECFCNMHPTVSLFCLYLCHLHTWLCRMCVFVANTSCVPLRFWHNFFCYFLGESPPTPRKSSPQTRLASHSFLSLLSPPLCYSPFLFSPPYVLLRTLIKNGVSVCCIFKMVMDGFKRLMVFSVSSGSCYEPLSWLLCLELEWLVSTH